MSQPIEAQGITVINEFNEELTLPDSLSMLEFHKQAEFTDKLQQWFYENGYLKAKIVEFKEARVSVTQGCVFGMTTFFDIGNGELSERIAPYSTQRLEHEIRQELAELNEQGFMNARAEIADFVPDLEACTVRISVSIQKGEITYARNMAFVGNRQNPDLYLQKIISYYDSLIITPSYLQNATQLLEYSGLFNEVNPAEFVLISGEPSILIQVQERPMNAFDGLLGYVPDDAGKGQIVGDLELSLWNVFTPGNGVDLLYKRLKPETSRLSLGVSQKWIGALPIGIEAGFDFYQNDTTYQTRTLELAGTYDFRNGLSMLGGVSRTTTTASESTTLEPGGKRNLAELGFLYTALQGGAVPKKGITMRVGFSTGSKSVEVDSVKAFPFQTLSSTLRWYVPISTNSVLAFRTVADFSLADGFTESDLYRLGGAKSMRGYAEEQFRASRAVWGDLEYRFHTDAASYLFVFGAAGGYHRPKLLTEAYEQFTTTDYLYSIGLGLSYAIKVGRLTLTYALSPEETIGNGKVHVGISTRL